VFLRSLRISDPARWYKSKIETVAGLLLPGCIYPNWVFTTLK